VAAVAVGDAGTELENFLTAQLGNAHLLELGGHQLCLRDAQQLGRRLDACLPERAQAELYVRRAGDTQSLL
jgi:hypothetical protein